MSGDVTRADWLAGIRGGRTDWTGLADRRRLQLAAPKMLAALEAIEAYEDAEPEPGTREAEIAAMRRAAIASATGDA
jgi:hypothetical protein